ncbi:trimethylamine-N-oxide reductase TorA [Biostraticola tofi]|uniref:trimethylamine-N-oxide reductase n=1 Tax=Biostraticola tofi TaxID=466109 RepID=A0A4R3YL99_9GAMM|nr:trimethylamine-N-oxide reductase TorA [Biostraticola tofi]TCV93046.1 trimethylamine-N-oxide reductase (cytochrome c) [Biostraticola tofi]
MDNSTLSGKLSRRRFLSASGAIAAAFFTAGLWPKSALAEAIAKALPEFTALRAAREGVLSAAHWGAFEATITDGRLIRVKPIQDDPAANELVQMVPEQVHAANRIRCPMARKSWLEGGPGSHTELRGQDQWVRLSWDKAISLVGDEILRIQRQHGPQAIYAGSYGWKSVGLLHNCQALLKRLMNLAGGFLGYTGDYSTGAAQIIMPHVVGSIEVYEQQTTWPNVIEHSQLVVLWGCNPLVTLRNSWNVPDHVGAGGFMALKKKGTRIICIDPVKNESARQLDAEWIAPRPYTDCALMMGLAHTLLVEKRHDIDFIRDYTVGFEPFSAYLVGEQDGQAKDADWAADLCGISAAAIRQLARDMASQRTMIMAGWGIQRQHHGEQQHWMLVTLAAMLGQIGLPGGGFGFSYHYSSGGSPRATGGVLSGMTAGKAPKGAPTPIPVARIADCLANPGKTIAHNGRTLTYPDVKMVYVAGGNTLQQHQDINNLIKAWQRPETIVVNEPYWTATARYADIVLPATTSYERNDLEMGGDYSGRYIFPMHQCVAPQHEARDDFAIFSALAAHIGHEQAFTEGKTELEWLEAMYEAMRRQAAIADVALPPFPLFWSSNNYVRFPLAETDQQWVRFADYREDPLMNPLGTPSGKIEITSETIAAMGYDDSPAHPTWMTPHEWYRGPEAERFPLSLSSGHPVNRLHSQLDNTSLRDNYAVAGREAVLINRQDAALRGIRPGDLVRVWNDRGQVLVGAVVGDDIRPGVIRINEGAWYGALDAAVPGSLCINGSVNCLTFDIGSSQLAQGSCGQMAQVQMEKYRGETPENTAHRSPVDDQRL